MGVFLTIQEANTLLDNLSMNDDGKYSIENLYEILNTY
jgi:hypothetical protein